ncbi:hypothetical protein GCM10009000_034530 [Halobacterium noricense]
MDGAMATVVDRYDPDTVRTVIKRVLVVVDPFRTTTADLDVNNIDRARIETAATRFLAELNAQGDDCVRWPRFLTLRACVVEAPKPLPASV